MMKYILLILVAVVLLPAEAQKGPVRLKHFNLEKTLALDGYDPVSYFQTELLEGKSGISTLHNGVRYLFSSVENKSEFLKRPERYEPAYGGWCAYAMGESGEKVKVDPKTFKIINDRLYLFYNFWGNNTLKDWNKDEKPLKSRADIAWDKWVTK